MKCLSEFLAFELKKNEKLSNLILGLHDIHGVPSAIVICTVNIGTLTFFFFSLSFFGIRSILN